MSMQRVAAAARPPPTFGLSSPLSSSKSPSPQRSVHRPPLRITPTALVVSFSPTPVPFLDLLGGCGAPGQQPPPPPAPLQLLVAEPHSQGLCGTTSRSPRHRLGMPPPPLFLYRVCNIYHGLGRCVCLSALRLTPPPPITFFGLCVVRLWRAVQGAPSPPTVFCRLSRYGASGKLVTGQPTEVTGRRRSSRPPSVGYPLNSRSCQW